MLKDSYVSEDRFISNGLQNITNFTSYENLSRSPKFASSSSPGGLSSKISLLLKSRDLRSSTIGLVCPSSLLLIYHLEGGRIVPEEVVMSKNLPSLDESDQKPRYWSLGLPKVFLCGLARQESPMASMFFLTHLIPQTGCGSVKINLGLLLCFW